MIESLRNFLESTAGKITGMVVSLIAVGVGIYAIMSYFKGDTPESVRSRMYICTETHKTFRHDSKMGETLPIYSSYSGKNTGVPAEACYWTADGQEKKEPTWVLMKEYNNERGPTFCPDCGRLVIGHNPAPGPDAKVPPTEKEYAARRPQNNRDGR